MVQASQILVSEPLNNHQHNMSTDFSYCRQCGQATKNTSAFCPHCGSQQHDNANTPNYGKQLRHLPASPQTEALTGWSWGALVFGPIWAVFNKIKPWMSLLALIPITEIPMTIVLAFKGRQWSWESGAWKDIEHFNRVQKKWDRVAIVFITIAVAIGVGLLVRELNLRQPSSAENTSPGQRSPEFYQNTTQEKMPADLMAIQPGYSTARLLELLEKNQYTRGPVSNQVSTYMQLPDEFWQSCIASNKAYAKNNGGLSDQEALEWATNSCTDQARTYKACIALGNSEAAAMCFIGYAIHNAENGD